VTLTVLSVNVRPAAEVVDLGSRRVETGIRKLPVASADVHANGLAGDVVADAQHHGGADQAVYVYSAEDLAWWETELGTPLAAGAFGENLTLSGFGPSPVRIGDRFRLGDVVLEATAARVPCAVFARHVAQPNWVKRFTAARRPGFYARVLAIGRVAAGDPVEPLGGGEEHPEIVETLDAYFDPSPSPQRLAALLAAPVAQRARREYEEKAARRA
jgi:MOSC domain-containing protein YiiM